MLKQFTAWVVLASSLAIVLTFKFALVKADNSSPWVGSAISIQKQADVQAAPTSLNGNIDCSMDGAINCAMPTTYGTATQNSTVQLNGSTSYLPVSTYIENKPRIVPVPNSNTVISYTTEPAYGFYLYFNYNFSSSINLINDYSGAHYQITRSPDGVLADTANHRLAADYGSMSFSQNGQWMVVSDPNVAMLRINLSTFQVLPFAPGFNYTVGIDPSLKTTISNDGRYVVVASQGFSSWKVYDLSTCATVPASISGPVDCQSRDVKAEFNQQISGYNFASDIRFINDDTLAAYVNYKDDSANKTARFIVGDKLIGEQLEYLALGDSFISGEGALDYQPTTDNNDNLCHSSYQAYPMLIGHDLNYDSYRSVACSGAVAGDITDTSIPNSAQNKAQARGKNDASFDDEIYSNFLPGYRAQINFVELYQPQIITLSIGGNDMGFSNILKKCVSPWDNETCYDTYEDRLELINQIHTVVYPRLVQTYQQIKASSRPDTRLYIIGYPQIVKPDSDCALNVHFNNDEITFAQELITYLDSVISVAASKTGAYYVDTQDALIGHRLCEAGPGSVAVNGLTAGNDSPSRLIGPIGNESYHPNSLGHELLENKILSETHNLTAPMPSPDANASLSGLTNQDILNIPHDGRQTYSVQYDNGIAGDFAFQEVPVDISIDGATHSLTPSSNLQAEIHSNPVGLGKFRLDQNGNLSTRLVIPNTVSAGYHTLHFYGTDINGQQVDIYKYIYLASTADDLDGNGVADSAQACVGIDASGQDYDQDGIDDACDPNITMPVTNAIASATTELESESLSVLTAPPESSTSYISDDEGASTDNPSTNSSTRSPTAVLAAKTSNLRSASRNDDLRLSSTDFEIVAAAVILLCGLAWAIL